jgi:NAD(P)-dependent dehydrogenase (short-subunit alcohol dehydrogenase family)
MTTGSRHGEVAVITGGAGGIGKASAELWVAEGGKVVACDIDDEKGEAFAAAYPGKVVYVHCDTRNVDDLEAAAAAADKLGTLTCWFNNAGGGSPIDNIFEGRANIDGLKKMVDININACMQGTYVALSHFEARGGVVITTASMAGLLPVGAPPVYSMTKAANIHFTRAIASAYGEDSNIRHYALCPSYTATAMGPDPALIKASIGGILTAQHQAEGFMMLASGTAPNGSVMRVTARRGGTMVVHDLVAYGKELGGPETARPGKVMKEAPLLEYTGPMDTHEGFKDLAKL